METRTPATPASASPEFYAGRPEADHINQAKHALRLYLAASHITWWHRFGGVSTLVDLGAGNGGLLGLLCLLAPDLRACGVDIMPANIDAARAKGLNVVYRDITKDCPTADMVVLTEVLEHLEDPKGLVSGLPAGTLILATVPARETLKRHWPHHLWIWDAFGFKQLFLQAGCEVITWDTCSGVHLVVARRKQPC